MVIFTCTHRKAMSLHTNLTKLRHYKAEKLQVLVG